MKLIKKHQSGGGFKRGNNFTNKQIYNKLNPGGGFDIISYLFWNNDFKNRDGNTPRKGAGNVATPDEESYLKKYLDLPGSNVPKMNPEAKTSWDNDEEKKLKIKSTFVGTTPEIDKRIQAIVDTTNTGKIFRDYDYYKSKISNLPDKDKIGEIYKFGKRVLDNPYKKDGSPMWHQANEGLSIKEIEETKDHSSGSGLGALSNFGIRWNPKNNSAYIHDTYDFPEKLMYLFDTQDYIPIRKSELKIRGKVYLPKEGSYLLRNKLINYNK